MGFSKIASSVTNVIRLLNDKPNDVDGMSATDLKEKFDTSGQGIADFINETLIPEIEGKGADNIIIPAGDHFSKDMTLNECLEYIADNIKTSVITALPDRSITEKKLTKDCVSSYELASGAVGESEMAENIVSTDKLKAGAVTTAKIADQNITTEKIADGAVTNGKILDGAITAGKISDYNVTNQKIADRAVSEGKLADNAVTEAKISDGNVTHNKLSSDAVYYATYVVLDTGKTYWEKSVNGVTASNHVIASPANDTSWTDWVNKGVRLSSQGNGKLVFAARSATTTQITVNILIIR